MRNNVYTVVIGPGKVAVLDHQVQSGVLGIFNTTIKVNRRCSVEAEITEFHGAVDIGGQGDTAVDRNLSLFALNGDRFSNAADAVQRAAHQNGVAGLDLVHGSGDGFEGGIFAAVMVFVVANSSIHINGRELDSNRIFGKHLCAAVNCICCRNSSRIQQSRGNCLVQLPENGTSLGKFIVSDRKGSIAVVSGTAKLDGTALTSDICKLIAGISDMSVIDTVSTAHIHTTGTVSKCAINNACFRRLYILDAILSQP